MSADIEEIFPLLLAEQEAVTAIVTDRFYPNRLPDREKLPAVIIRRVSGGAIGHASGYGGVSKATFQVESWSEKNQDEARELNLAVQGIKMTQAGQVGSWWVQSLRLNPDTDQDNPQIPTHADDLGLFCSFTEFIVFYKRGV